MQIKLSRILSSIIVLIAMSVVPENGLASSAEKFPFHIGDTVNKEVVYPYTFEETWNAALTSVREMSDIAEADLKWQEYKEPKVFMESDRSAGLITLKVTHKGKRSFLQFDPSAFTYRMLFIRSVEDQMTCVKAKEINYISYDGDRYTEKESGPHLSFIPSKVNIHDEILKRLGKK